MESSRIAPRGVSSFSVARSMEKALASEQQLKPWYSKVLCMGRGNLAIGCTTLILVSTLHAFFPGMELHLFREWTEGVPSNCVNVITSHYDPRYIRWLLLNGNCFLDWGVGYLGPPKMGRPWIMYTMLEDMESFVPMSVPIILSRYLLSANLYAANDSCTLHSHTLGMALNSPHY